MNISKRLALKTLNSLSIPKEQKEKIKPELLKKLSELKNMTREELEQEFKKCQ